MPNQEEDAIPQAGDTDDGVVEMAEAEETVDDTPEDQDSAFSSQITLSVDGGAGDDQEPVLPYPVVGIGASAGGLQAFREILDSLEPGTGMAFVLITHLSPEHKSFINEIVACHTRMEVCPIENGERPLPDHIYVLGPGSAVILSRGYFQVGQLSAERTGNLIDRFFVSLAANQRYRAIGVVLSGSGGDGTSGLKAIKGESGITLVQSPETAVNSSMPLTSIAAEDVDLILSPREIAEELGRIGRQPGRPGLALQANGGVSQGDEQTFQIILQQLRSQSGLDLRQYKPQTVRRRIARRMLLLRLDTMSAYLKVLMTRPDELRTLQDDVLINVTRFFRDPGLWDSLRANVLPILTQDRPLNKSIRIWCAGCSTGEEAYSLSILILEYLAEAGLEIPVQIFGTDAGEQAIETARNAVYRETIAAEVSPERLRRYFVKLDHGYQVSKRVRDTCIFARQNLASDPPFSHIDIVSCRNVMIYFNQALQRQVMLTFHYALEHGGYMVLGMSEGLRDYGEVFSTVDRTHKVYLKTGASLSASIEAPRRYFLNPVSNSGRVNTPALETSVWPEVELQRAADRMVMARFGPPGLIIDEHLNVLQSRGQMSSFLDIPPGVVTWNLLRVVRNSLARHVQIATERAIREGIPASATIRLLDENEGEATVQVEVLPISSPSIRPKCFLVLFLKRTASAAKILDVPARARRSRAETHLEVAQLRQDLAATRYHLQSLVEERDAHHQELVSANEEIRSANEELQSTNEELETTKEELQSANEELQTVNDELQQRNHVLTQTGNDLTNLLYSVNIPLLMLTNSLHIRQFTPPMEKLLSIRESDVGRSIGEIRLQLSVGDLEPILREVLDTLGTREIEVQDRTGRWYLLRVRPYRTAENSIDGLVMVLVDIDKLRRSQQSLWDAHDFARSVVECVPVPVVVLNGDCTIRTMNSSFRSLTGMVTEDLENRSFPEIALHLWGLDGVRERFRELMSEPAGTVHAFEHESSSPKSTILQVKARVISTDGDPVVLLTMEDVAERRYAERTISKQKEELEREVELAARNLTQTQEELRRLAGHLFTVQEQERQRVARELHDDISQRLSLLEIALQEAKCEGASRKDLDSLLAVRRQVEALNTDVRLISHRLHPAILHDLGLSAALLAMVKDFGERENMPATYLTQDLPESWSEQCATALYRIAQEALRNVAKHAGKTHVKVTLAGLGDQLQLKVSDFGFGFDQDSDTPVRGLGMISMQERARLAGGTVVVRSALGEGTTVAAEVPVDAES